jgi:hypothetical protein
VAYHLLGVIAALDKAVHDFLGRWPEGEVVDRARLGVAASAHDSLYQQLVRDLRPVALLVRHTSLETAYTHLTWLVHLLAGVDRVQPY